MSPHKTAQHLLDLLHGVSEGVVWVRGGGAMDTAVMEEVIHKS